MSQPHASRTPLTAGAGLALLLTVFAALGQTPTEPQPLPPGRALERELAGAASHAYGFELRVGEFFQVRVEQRGVDAALRLSRPGGGVVATMDSPNGKQGPETLSFVAAEAGSFVLEVVSPDAKAEKGSYLIERQSPRAATPQDRRRVEVERLFVEAVRLRQEGGQAETALARLEEASKGWRELADAQMAQLSAQTQAELLFDQARKSAEKGTAESRQAALSMFEGARRLFQELNNKQSQAHCLDGIATQHNLLGRKAEALDYFRQSATLHREVGNKAAEAATHANAGWVYRSTNRLEEAVEAFTQAVSAYQGTHKPLEMVFRAVVGGTYSSLKQHRKALEFSEPALTFFRAAKADELKELTEAQRKSWEMTALQTTASAYQSLGETEKASELQIQLLPLFREDGDKASEIIYTSSIGTNYNSLGKYPEALSYFEAALARLRAADPKEFAEIESVRPKVMRGAEINVLSGAGQAHLNLGQKQKALDYFRQSIQLCDEVGDRKSKQSILMSLSQVHELLYEWDRAEEAASQSLAAAEELGDKGEVARVLNHVGRLYHSRQQKRKALGFYERSLDAVREAMVGVTQQPYLNGLKRVEAGALNNTGLVYSDLGDNRKALEFYGQALAIHQETGDKDEEAVTYSNIAYVYSLRGEKLKALDYLKLARETFEKTPARIKASTRVIKAEAHSLNSIGNINADLGNLREALDYYNLALSDARNKGLKDLEATILGNIGAVYSYLGEPRKSLELYNQSLTLDREIENKEGEAAWLINLGHAHADLGDNQEALRYFGQALSLAKAIEDKERVAVATRSFGKIYAARAQYRNALSYLNQALAMSREIEDKRGEAVVLGDLGLLYAETGDREKALDHIAQAHVIIRETGDVSNEAILLSNQGKVYFDLGEHRTARDYYEQSLKLAQGVGAKGTQATTMNVIGRVLWELGERQKALAFLEQSLALSSATGYKAQQMHALRNLGILRAELGDGRQGERLLAQSLKLSRQQGDQLGEGRSLSALGRVYAGAGEKGKALDSYNQASLIAREIGDREGEALAYKGLMGVWESLGNPKLAVLYGKQAVNKYQELRGLIRNLKKETQGIYREKVSDTYHALADILIAQGRLPEAEQVLSMLKEDEFLRFVLRDAGEAAGLSQNVALGQDERKALADYARLADGLTAKGARHQTLFEKRARRGGKLEAAEEEEYKKLKAEIEDASDGLKKFLEHLAAEFSKKVEDGAGITPGSIASFQSNLRGSDGTVLVSTYLLPERYRVIVTTGNTMVDRKVEYKERGLTAKGVNDKIFAFKQALEHPCACHDPRPLGKELYDIFFKPIEKDLRGAKVLLWSLDGVLRYIPIHALYDGERYLAERYENVLVTLARQAHLFDEPSRDGWRALGLGVSQKHPGFSELPAVLRELRAIVRESQETQGVWPGRRLLNSDFSADSLRTALSSTPADGKSFNLLHLATHFKLGNTNADSAMLLGDGTLLSLREIDRDLELRFNGVELLTLSACRTGVSVGEANGHEIESLGMLMQQKGAKAVLATLWAVADESTSLLMAEFYRLRKENPGLTKAGALQLAQRAMIEGRLLPPAGAGARRGSELAGRPVPGRAAFPADEAKPYSHPYFWSPFVLIGNWK